ncbi:lactonase family protein [Rugosimonospora acidiphila]|uniref:Lactonase family protein n=1 Tax=Rugosimonospora acidiphila TaxID=556531 RepID=A0ABP9RQX5_9ACTN
MTDLVYVGSYGAGISIYGRQDERLTLIDRVDTPDPSFLVADTVRGALFACNELTANEVSSFAIEPDGRLRLLSHQPTAGTLPCHLLLHPAGYLMAANFGSGSVSVHPVMPDGTLGELVDLIQHNGRGADPERQAGPHAHEVKVVSGEVVVVDLGLDRLVGYQIDAATGKLTRAADPFARSRPGAGPRHAVAHPSGRWYVANELDSTISIFEPDFELRELHLTEAVSATLSEPKERNFPAGIALSADDRHLYVSNRGANTIVTFGIDDAGSLHGLDETPCDGVWPRHFAIVDDVLMVANEQSSTVTGFRLDPATGVPQPLGVLAETGTPTCILPVRLRPEASAE